MSENLILNGLDGANPLGFLAALGTLALTAQFSEAPKLQWQPAGSGFCPALSGIHADHSEFIDALQKCMSEGSPTAFSTDKRLPFSSASFRDQLVAAVLDPSAEDRFNLDLLAALGTEVHHDNKGNFADTAFRMVRSGDAAGQGLPAYALAIWKNTDQADLHRTLFQDWDYRDNDFSLRWDPLEDQRYALRWYDPSPESNKRYGLRSMRGANALALAGLALMPVQPGLRKALTTGFSTLGRRRECFTWPIWEVPTTIDVVRSLVALSELQKPIPSRKRLESLGIVEIYRSERIAANQYYRNFSPAAPV